MFDQTGVFMLNRWWFSLVLFFRSLFNNSQLDDFCSNDDSHHGFRNPEYFFDLYSEREDEREYQKSFYQDKIEASRKKKKLRREKKIYKKCEYIC